MASSVSSASEMSKWADQRRTAAARTVPVNLEARKNFNALMPDYEQLAKHEERVQRLAERQEAKEQELEIMPKTVDSETLLGSGSPMCRVRRFFGTKAWIMALIA